MPVHHYILEVYSLLSGFSVSQLERNFVSGLTIPQVSPTPDLDDSKNGGLAKETLMYRTVLWTLLERKRVGRFGRMALKHV